MFLPQVQRLMLMFYITVFIVRIALSWHFTHSVSLLLWCLPLSEWMSVIFLHNQQYSSTLPVYRSTPWKKLSIKPFFIFKSSNLAVYFYNIYIWHWVYFDVKMSMLHADLPDSWYKNTVSTAHGWSGCIIGYTEAREKAEGAVK